MKSFIALILLILLTSFGHTQILEVTPSNLSKLMQLPVIRNYLEHDELNGFYLIRNPFTVQILNEYNHLNPGSEEYSLLDVLEKFNQKSKFRQFLKKRPHYAEYFNWLEYRLTQSLFGVIEELDVDIYSDINAALLSIKSEEKNLNAIFKTLADEFTRLKIHKSYEEMYNTITFSFSPDSNSMLYQINTVGLMTSGELGQLYTYALSKIHNEESLNHFNTYLAQLRNELMISPKNENFNYILSKVDFELSKLLLNSIIGGGTSFELDNCNLYMGVVNLDRSFHN